jgi:Tol biopolymer transport system component
VFLYDRDPDGNGIFDEGNGTIVRVSVADTGKGGNGPSASGRMSLDGRWVAFESYSINLVPNDTNLADDIFVHDRDPDGNGIFDEGAGTNVRVSIATSGAQANGDSTTCRISSSGRYVCFFSYATNLAPGAVPGQLYVHDRDPDGNGIFDEGNGKTVQVSVTESGAQPWDHCYWPSISGDGRYVAFESLAANLVPNDFNAAWDVFVHDRDPDGNGIFDEDYGTNVRVSVDANGQEKSGGSSEPAISRDGRYVAFASEAIFLPVPPGNIYLRDLKTDTLSVVSTNAAGFGGNSGSTEPTISGDGRYVTFTSNAFNLVKGDTNDWADTFLKDRITLQFVGTPSQSSPVHYEVTNAIGETGHRALVFLSCTGEDGFPLSHGRSVPLTFDACTAAGIGMYQALLGTIDASGTADTPSIIFPPLPAGVTIYSAAVTIDLATGAFPSITGPISFVTQ